MSDLLRNQVAITLAGEERVMQASFGALRGIEQALGESIISTIARARLIGVTDCAVIIFNGLKGYNDTRLTLEQVGEAVVDQGLAAIGLPCMKFLSIAMNGVSVGKPEEAAQ